MTILDKPDRLSALIDRFELAVRLCPPDEANLAIVEGRDGDTACRLRFGRAAAHCGHANEMTVFSAVVDWGGADNPLMTALPDSLDIAVEPGSELEMVARLLMEEQRARRCGSASVLNRLGEVLVVRIIRGAIERGATQTGLLGGLADPRLSRAIVAIHEAPGRHWSVEELADVAGLSRSRFAELFFTAVGQTPSSYLRQWRLTLARRDIERGLRVESVAGRYGYRSGEALNRAFKQRYGDSPRAYRRREMAAAT